MRSASAAARSLANRTDSICSRDRVQPVEGFAAPQLERFRQALRRLVEVTVGKKPTTLLTEPFKTGGICSQRPRVDNISAVAELDLQGKRRPQPRDLRLQGVGGVARATPSHRSAIACPGSSGRPRATVSLARSARCLSPRTGWSRPPTRAVTEPSTRTSNTATNLSIRQRSTPATSGDLAVVRVRAASMHS